VNNHKAIPPRFARFLAVQSLRPRKPDCQDCGAIVRHIELIFFLPNGNRQTIQLPVCPNCHGNEVTEGVA
jgi:hypothetical protein